MPISGTSPLRLLPANLDRKQMLFFDGIRVATEMIESAYSRLEQTLQRAATVTLPEDETRRLVPECFLDAWSIIDSVNRLRALLKRLPKFKQKAPSLQVLYRKTEVVELLRNTVQHLDTEIDRLVKNNFPVWGTITWLVVVDGARGEIKAGAIASGTQFGGMIPIPNPAGLNFYSKVDHINLVADGNEVNLSEITRNVTDFITKLEALLLPKFSGHQPAPSDFLVVADMMVAPSHENAKNA